MDNLKTFILIFHGLTIAMVLYLSSFLLTARFDSSIDKTIFITLGTLIFINSMLRIRVLTATKNKALSLLSNVFRGIQLLITGLLITDMFMRNIGSLERGLIYLLVINGILAIIYWSKKNEAKKIINARGNNN